MKSKDQWRSYWDKLDGTDDKKISDMLAAYIGKRPWYSKLFDRRKHLFTVRQALLQKTLVMTGQELLSIVARNVHDARAVINPDGDLARVFQIIYEKSNVAPTGLDKSVLKAQFSFMMQLKVTEADNYDHIEDFADNFYPVLYKDSKQHTLASPYFPESDVLLRSVNEAKTTFGLTTMQKALSGAAVIGRDFLKLFSTTLMRQKAQSLSPHKPTANVDIVNSAIHSEMTAPVAQVTQAARGLAAMVGAGRTPTLVTGTATTSSPVLVGEPRRQPQPPQDKKPAAPTRLVKAVRGALASSASAGSVTADPVATAPQPLSAPAQPKQAEAHGAFFPKGKPSKGKRAKTAAGKAFRGMGRAISSAVDS